MSGTKWLIIILAFVSLLGYVGWLKYDNAQLQKTIVEKDTKITMLEISGKSAKDALDQANLTNQALVTQLSDLQKAHDTYVYNSQRNKEIIEKARLEPIDTTKVADYETVQKAKDILSIAPTSDGANRLQYKD